MVAPDRRLFGLLLVGGATALWSTAGIFVRLVDLDVWTILGWRSVFAVLALLVIVVMKRRSAAPTTTAPTAVLWLAVPIATISMGAYVVALKLTTVANVMVVYAAVPFVTALLAWAIIGERITGRMLAASLAAMAPGVSGALITTVTGLLVAIPAMFGYNYLTTSIRHLNVEMENFAAECGAVFEHRYFDRS